MSPLPPDTTLGDCRVVNRVGLSNAPYCARRFDNWGGLDTHKTHKIRWPIAASDEWLAEQRTGAARVAAAGRGTGGAAAWSSTRHDHGQSLVNVRWQRLNQVAWDTLKPQINEH